MDQLSERIWELAKQAPGFELLSSLKVDPERLWKIDTLSGVIEQLKAMKILTLENDNFTTWAHIANHLSAKPNVIASRHEYSFKGKVIFHVELPWHPHNQWVKSYWQAKSGAGTEQPSKL